MDFLCYVLNTISSMTTMKYEIPLLDRNTRFSLYQVKMCVVLAQMDIDDVLLGLNKMLSLWTEEEKQRKDRKALSHIHFHYQIRFYKMF